MTGDDLGEDVVEGERERRAERADIERLEGDRAQMAFLD